METKKPMRKEKYTMSSRELSDNLGLKGVVVNVHRNCFNEQIEIETEEEIKEDA